MYVILQANDRDWDDTLSKYRFIGRTEGCGCCSDWQGLTRQDVIEHIAELREQIEKAETILAQLEG